MSTLFAPFLYLHYSYNQSCNCVLPAAVNCGPAPDAPANGQQIASGAIFGSTVTYTCNRGYTLQGDSRHTCMANGEWSGKTPTCSRKLLAIRHTCSTIASSYMGIKSLSKAVILQCDDSWGFTWIYKHRTDKQQVDWQYTCSAWLWSTYAQCVQSIVTHNIMYIGPLWLVVMCAQIHACTCTISTMVYIWYMCIL